MTVTARVFDDAEEFAAVSEAFVRSDPARSTVLATVLAGVVAGLRSYPGSSWLVAEESGQVVGVAMQVPPHRLWLSAMPEAAAASVAALMAGRLAAGALPGFAGARRSAEAAAARWLELRPDETTVEVRALRSYALDALLRPQDVPGHAREITNADLPMVHAWMAAFCVEAEVDILDVEETTALRLAGHGAFHVWEDAGALVSLAGHSAQVAGMVRIGPVYTPPEQRRCGYGAAVTAATSKHALDGGATQVVLFTDLANPVSNSIYQAIGYVPGADFVELDLVGPAPGGGEPL